MLSETVPDGFWLSLARQTLLYSVSKNTRQTWMDGSQSQIISSQSPSGFARYSTGPFDGYRPIDIYNDFIELRRMLTSVIRITTRDIRSRCRASPQTRVIVTRRSRFAKSTVVWQEFVARISASLGIVVFSIRITESVKIRLICSLTLHA